MLKDMLRLLAVLLLALMGVAQAGVMQAQALTPAPCTREYRPVCAIYQPRCVRAPCPVIRQTFPNACEARAAGARVIHPGACRKKESWRRGGVHPRCRVWLQDCNICQRQRPGGHAACTMRACAKTWPVRKCRMTRKTIVREGRKVRIVRRVCRTIRPGRPQPRGVRCLKWFRR